MTEKLHSIDLFIILLYIIGILATGLIQRNSKKGKYEYLLAGRRLTIIPFTASLVATWYGGILGVGEFTYQYGISNWVVMGLPYYIFASIFAFLFAKKIREQNLFTIPERLRHHYGECAGYIGAGLVSILSTPAPYILSCAFLVSFLFNITILSATLFSTAISFTYVHFGGFRAVVRTDLIQCVIMYAAFSILVFTCAKNFAGFQEMKMGLPSLHLSWHGGNSLQYIAVWFFVALWTFIDPNFYHRCIAAKTASIARRGIFTSIGFWALFDFLTISAGLYSRLLVPELSIKALSLPILGLNILPTVAKGIFFAGLLATIMSTIDSLGLISGITIGRDILWRTGKIKSQEKAIKVGVIITTLLSLIFVWIFPSIIKLWYSLGSTIIPGLLIPFIATFWIRKPIRNMPAIMLFSTFSSLLWFIIGQLTNKYPFGLEPLYPGLAVSLVWLIIQTKATRIRILFR